MLFQEVCVNAKRFVITLLEPWCVLWCHFCTRCALGQCWPMLTEGNGVLGQNCRIHPTAQLPLGAGPARCWCGSTTARRGFVPFQAVWIGFKHFVFKLQNVNYLKKNGLLPIERFYFGNLKYLFQFHPYFLSLFSLQIRRLILSRQHFAAKKELYSKCQIVFSHRSSLIF